MFVPLLSPCQNHVALYLLFLHSNTVYIFRKAKFQVNGWISEVFSRGGCGSAGRAGWLVIKGRWFKS